MTIKKKKKKKEEEEGTAAGGGAAAAAPAAKGARPRSRRPRQLARSSRGWARCRAEPDVRYLNPSVDRGNSGSSRNGLSFNVSFGVAVAAAGGPETDFGTGVDFDSDAARASAAGRGSTTTGFAVRTLFEMGSVGVVSCAGATGSWTGSGSGGSGFADPGIESRIDSQPGNDLIAFGRAS